MESFLADRVPEAVEASGIAAPEQPLVHPCIPVAGVSIEHHDENQLEPISSPSDEPRLPPT